MAVTKTAAALLVVGLVIGVLLGLTIRIVRAEQETFTVPPGRDITRSLQLNNEDKVSGSISVVGGAGNDVNFFVTDPNGNTILRCDRATQTSFSFTASISGTYILHFDNSFSIISSKSVTLSYRISRAVYGIRQDIFLITVVAGVIIAVTAIAAIVIIAKRESKPKSQE